MTSRTRINLRARAACVALAAVGTFAGTFLATFDTPLNSRGADTAQASHVPNTYGSRPCAEYYRGPEAIRAAQITEAVYNVTGNFATEDACDLSLYNNGVWSTQAQLQGYVEEVMNRCSGVSGGLTGQAGRNLTLAVVTKTGIPPAGNVCRTAPYSNHHFARCPMVRQQDGTYRYAAQCAGGINWSVYDYKDPGLEPGQATALAGVSSLLNVCATSEATVQAIVQVTGQVPQTFHSQWVNYPANSGDQVSGQCNRGLYNNGIYFSYETPLKEVGKPQPRGLLEAVSARANSTGSCSNSSITAAYQQLTGWNPVGNGTSGECDPRRYGYGAGTWDYAELKRLIAMSFRCFDPWVSQVYASDFNRGVRSEGGNIGECSLGLYGRGYLGTGTYSAFRDRVITAQSVMSQRGLSFDGNEGNLDVTFQLQGIPFSYELPSDKVLMASDPVYLYRGNGIISDKGLGVIAAGGGNVRIDFSAPVIAAGGGNVIAAGGGNVISLGSGNVIAQGALNVIAAGGGNIVSDAGAGVIPQGGGNVITAGNGN